MAKTGVYPFCHENYFYGNEKGKKDDFSQDVEDYFTQIENEMYPAMQDFEDKVLNNKALTDTNRFLIAGILVLFEIRGKRGAEKSDNMIQQLFDQLRDKDNLSDNDIMKMIGVTQDNIIVKSEKVHMSTNQHLQHLQQLENLKDRVVHLVNKDWIIEVSRNGDFIVTDTPSFEWSPDYTGIFSQTIYDRTQVFIFSPKVVIFIRKPASVTDVRYYLSNNPVPKSPNTLKVLDITDNSDNIDIINATLFDYSVLFGFHHDRNILERLLDCTRRNISKQ